MTTETAALEGRRAPALALFVLASSLVGCGGPAAVAPPVAPETRPPSDVAPSIPTPTPADVDTRIRSPETVEPEPRDAAESPLPTQTEVIDELAHDGNPRAVELLADAVLDDSFEVREASLDALAEIGSDAALDVMRTALDAPDVETREAAVDAIADLDPRRGAPLLHQALSDPDPAIRELAMQYLEEHHHR